MDFIPFPVELQAKLAASQGAVVRQVSQPVSPVSPTPIQSETALRQRIMEYILPVDDTRCVGSIDFKFAMVGLLFTHKTNGLTPALESGFKLPVYKKFVTQVIDEILYAGKRSGAKLNLVPLNPEPEVFYE